MSSKPEKPHRKNLLRENLESVKNFICCYSPPTPPPETDQPMMPSLTPYPEHLKPPQAESPKPGHQVDGRHVLPPSPVEQPDKGESSLPSTSTPITEGKTINYPLAIYEGPGAVNQERPPGTQANKKEWSSELSKGNITTNPNVNLAETGSKQPHNTGSNANNHPLPTENKTCSPEAVPNREPISAASPLHLIRLFKCTGQLEYINTAITKLEDSLGLASDGDNSIPMLLNQLGTALTNRFNYSRNLADIDQAISVQRKLNDLVPETDKRKPICLSSLGTAYRSRYSHLGDISDLNQAIMAQEKAAALTDDEDDKLAFLNNLGSSLRLRFERMGFPADIDAAVSRQEQALALTPMDHGDKPAVFNNLGISLTRRFESRGNLVDIDQAISFQEQAVALTSDDSPTKPGYLIGLGVSLQTRFQHTGNLADMDNSVSIDEKAISLTPKDHALREERLIILGNALRRRFERLGNLEDIERAILLQSEAVSSTTDGVSDKPSYLTSLATSLRYRFQQSEDIEDINMAITYQRQAISLTPPNSHIIANLFDDLSISLLRRFDRVDVATHLEEAISLQEQALALIPDGHAQKPGILSNLAILYQTRWSSSGGHDLGAINKAIGIQEQAASSLTEDDTIKTLLFTNLGNAFGYRFERFNDPADASKSLTAFRTAATSTAGSPTYRFQAARRWAKLAHVHDELSVLDAHRVAIDLIPRVIWLGTTISRRYVDIAVIGDAVSEAAAAAITSEKYGLALEWLEQGRSLVWGQILQLRTPVDDLRAVDAELADRLVEVSHALEETGIADSTKITERSRGVLSEKGAPTLRRMAEEWEKLVESIRNIPRFEDFLQPKRVSALASSAHSGPVVLVNVQDQRCDALILRYDATITPIPLSQLSPKKVFQLHRSLREELERTGVRERSTTRYYGKDNSALEKVLQILWSDIVKPVLDGLAYTPSSPSAIDLPHITWCPTGSLAFLPLHAAGNYSNEGVKLKIFEYVVSSYTPTLTALVESSRTRRDYGSLRLLAISQPSTPNQSPLPLTTLEIQNIQKCVGDVEMTWLNKDEATVERVLKEMETHSWIHLACHGVQRGDELMRSAFYLEDGTLELAAIMDKSFKHAEFAFLSACQTASGDEKRPDESFHLAAGMLMAGYRTVLATMWSIKDDDAPLIAEMVYSHLLGKGERGKAAAYALHWAVGDLRNKVGEKSFSSWVPFIHMGL